MSVEWPKIFLGDLYEYRSGLSKPRSAFGSGFGFLSFKDVFYNFFVPDQLTELVNSTAQERALCSIRRGDVFLTRTSETMEELGMSCVALKDYESATFNGFCKRLRPKPDTKVHPEYAAYYFRSPSFRRAVTAMSSMSTRASLNNEMLDRLIMLLPPLREQEAIGAILKKLDDKIELNRKMNRTLEEMAQAIFKSWFVDFDGVLDEEMIDSELGPIPKGWMIGNPGDLIEFDPTVPLRKGMEAVYVDMRALPTSGPSVSEWGQRPYAGGSRFQQNDTLLARITPCLENGKSALVDFLAKDESAFGSTEFIVMRPKPGIPRIWPYCLVRHEPFRAHAIANMTGSSGRQRVAVASLLNYQLAVPSNESLKQFGEITEPLFQRISQNSRESRTLSKIRDTLLPKLMSGEIRVPEAESAVETVL